MFFSLLIAGLIVFYAVRYRRRTPHAVGANIHGGLWLEVTWSVIPLMISMVIFVWGASVFFAMSRPPDETLNIYVVGKQWMWKFQHLDGQREINELHVPVGRAVKLIMTSEDVIHDVFVPAFRVKADVVPGRYTQLWFQADDARPLSPVLRGVLRHAPLRHDGRGRGDGADRIPGVVERRQRGRIARVGRRKALSGSGVQYLPSARRAGTRPRAPGPVRQDRRALQSGDTVVVDEAYLRESILNPGARITAGFQPIMPAFQGLVSEEQLLELIEYVKSLQSQPQGLPK